MKVKFVVTIGLTMSIWYKKNKILQLIVTIKFFVSNDICNENPISCIRQIMCDHSHRQHGFYMEGK